MTVEIRRTIDWTQTTFVEGGKVVETPTYLYAALAVIRNPWFGRGFVEDLSPEIKEQCPVIGKLLTENYCAYLAALLKVLAKLRLLAWAVKWNMHKH